MTTTTSAIRAASARTMFPLAALTIAMILLLNTVPAHAQQLAYWDAAEGDWSDCPPSGNAQWNTCSASPPYFPSGDFNVEIKNGPVIATSASIVNMDIQSGGTLLFAPNTSGILNITGSLITNNGLIDIESSNGLLVIGPTALLLTGKGSVKMVGSRFNGEASPNLTLQQPLRGSGLFAAGMSLTNVSTIQAQGGTLELQPTYVLNQGTLEASSGGTLAFSPGGPISFDNTNGAIKALSGGVVQLYGSTYAGGTLSSAGTGVIQLSGDAILQNVTSSATVQSMTEGVLQGAITNTGKILAPSSNISMSGPVTLSGSGSLTLSGTGVLGSFTGSDSLTSQQLIHGTGTIYSLPVTNQKEIAADSSGNYLYIDRGALTNTGIVEATAGGILQLDTLVNNTGGTIEAFKGSTVIFTGNYNGSINGGTLTTVGTGVIESQNGLLDGTVNIPTNAGTLTAHTFNLYIQGTINNAGTISISGNSCVVLNQASTLTGKGKLVMDASGCIYGSGLAFTNKSTIAGAGTIGDSNPMPITNSGTILANEAAPLFVNSGNYGFTNTGTLNANTGGTLTVQGVFNNLSGAGTLTGGTYLATGTIGIPGAIITNAGNITLTGASGEILNTSSGTNALSGMTSITTTGSLSLQSGQTLKTTTSLADSGKLTLGTGSSLTVGGSYTQVTGTATVDGTLTAPSVVLQKGVLSGTGTLAGAVSSDTTIVLGDSSTKPAKMTISGSYTQQTKGILSVSIGGTAAGTFGELAVSNGAAIAGVLNLKLINGFVPAVGDTYTILTGSAISGKFGTVNGGTINSTEHFEVNYSSTAVTLTVVSGA